MTNADLLAEYTDDEIEALKSAKRNALERTKSLQAQLDRAQLDLDNIDFRIGQWLRDLREELAHTCGVLPFCTLKAGHEGPCNANENWQRIPR